MWAWVSSWGAQEWAAFGAMSQALITVIVVWVALRQIRDIRDQNRRWRTLEACDRYCLEQSLCDAASILRRAINDGTYAKNPKKFRPEVIIVLNYLDGIAIGIHQGLYIEGLARDHMQPILQWNVTQYLTEGEPKKLDIDVANYAYLRALSDRWAAISQPHFRDLGDGMLKRLRQRWAPQ